jgi:hypothetical protein
MITTTTKEVAAFQKLNWPVSIAAKAKRKTIKLEASLMRLSPSRTVKPRFGILNPFSIEFAATASGGEIIPPSRNPSASVKPGIMAFEIKATVAEVKITSPNANRRIGRFHFHNSFHEMFHAVAYSKGGRKIRNTRSGFKVIYGTPGTRLIIRPATTSRIG